MVQDLVKLKGRLDRFTRKKTKHRHQLVTFLKDLTEIGNVALFGGVVRDLALEDINHLRSDVDLVIKIFPGCRLDDIIASFSPKRNSFGGYRLSLDKWYIDVWEFSDTWAFKQGIVRGNDFMDLLRTTFFTWDAIAFHVNKRKLLCADDYLHNLQKRILDINLEPNPNIEGAVVRTLRMLLRYDAYLTRHLAEYVFSNGLQIGFPRLLDIDRKDNIRRSLNETFIVQVFDELKFFTVTAENTFRLSHNQSDLFLVTNKQSMK